MSIASVLLYGRGTGVGRALGAGVALGAPLGVAVGVDVVVAVAVPVGVGVGLGAPDCAQYLPPVPKTSLRVPPPQTIISLSVHTAV